MAETILEMARRHVAEGERILAEQEARVEQLRSQGLPALEAEKALGTYRKLLQEMRVHLAHAESINWGGID
jgi:hypothetical protein